MSCRIVEGTLLNKMLCHCQWDSQKCKPVRSLIIKLIFEKDIGSPAVHGSVTSDEYKILTYLWVRSYWTLFGVSSALTLFYSLWAAFTLSLPWIFSVHPCLVSLVISSPMLFWLCLHSVFSTYDRLIIIFYVRFWHLFPHSQLLSTIRRL